MDNPFGFVNKPSVSERGSSPRARYEFHSGHADVATRAPAEIVLRKLVQNSSHAVYMQMRRNCISTAEELAGLDKDDLQILGLNMADRSRVLRWARAFTGADSEAQQGVTPSDFLPKQKLAVGTSSWELQVGPSGGDDQEAQAHLDEVMDNVDFWRDIAAAWASAAPLAAAVGHARTCADLEATMNSQFVDVRENILEGLFDISKERLEEVYHGMIQTDASVSVSELGEALRRCGLPAPTLEDDASGTLSKILNTVPYFKDSRLRLVEFEAIMSRLMLAQLLSRGMSRNAEDGLVTVIDYNVRGICEPLKLIDDAQIYEFLFGHRPELWGPSEAQSPLVRWVHMSGMDVSLLLSLTVKYGLHPLAVESAITQGPAKADRFGTYYFTSIEQLSLAGPADGTVPIQVRGSHVAVFCVGQPLNDTALTVAQEARNFADDWPGGHGGARLSSTWVDVIRERLKAPHSRMRERCADFLLYEVVDVSADELVALVVAYTARLSFLENELFHGEVALPVSWLDEVKRIHLQLGVVVRRVKGLQRVVRRMTQDTELASSLSGYWQDVLELLEEAVEDLQHLIRTSEHIEQAFEKAFERKEERERALQTDQQNTVLYVLAIVTTIFAPIQFIAGVYGMNFVDEEGKQRIPELRWKHGYMFFWALIVAYLVFVAIVWGCLYGCVRRKSRNREASLPPSETTPLLSPSHRGSGPKVTWANSSTAV